MNYNFDDLTPARLESMSDDEARACKDYLLAKIQEQERLMQSIQDEIDQARSAMREERRAFEEFQRKEEVVKEVEAKMDGLREGIRECLEDSKRKHILFLLETIFNPRNIDDDCARIAQLLRPIEQQIYDHLSLGENTAAINLFVQMLTVMAKHFVEDEHYCHFDDFYSPDFLAITIFDRLKQVEFAKKEEQLLISALEEVAKMEAVRNYGYPEADSWLREIRGKGRFYAD